MDKKVKIRRHGCLEAELLMIGMDYDNEMRMYRNRMLGMHSYIVVERIRQDFRNRLLSVQLEYARLEKAQNA